MNTFLFIYSTFIAVESEVLTAQKNSSLTLCDPSCSVGGVRPFFLKMISFFFYFVQACRTFVKLKFTC